MFLPPLTFVIVFVLVLKYHRPENHKAFRSFFWGLATALVIVLIGLIFTPSHSITAWALGINATVLAVWMAVIMWRRVTEDEDDSFQSRNTHHGDNHPRKPKPGFPGTPDTEESG